MQGQTCSLGERYIGSLRAIKPATSAAIALVCMVGTGGIADTRYFQKLQGYNPVAVRTITAIPTPTRSPREDLARLRGVLKPAISQLAGLFGVSRQSIYNWARGEQPKVQHIARLDDLARAADIIASEGITSPSQALNRKIVDGKTLLEIVAAGGSAQDAAHKLALILRRETEQRKAIEAKLAGRKSARDEVDDYGVPMLDETA